MSNITLSKYLKLVAEEREAKKEGKEHDPRAQDVPASGNELSRKLMYRQKGRRIARHAAYSLINPRTAGIVLGSMSLRLKFPVAEVAASASVIGPPSSNDKWCLQFTGW